MSESSFYECCGNFGTHTAECVRRAVKESQIPRRNRIDRNVPAELAIRKAMEAVEAMPADVRLTKAVTLLGDALNAVADFVDGVDALPAATTPASEPCGYLVTFDLEASSHGRRSEFYKSRNDADFHCRKLAERNSTIVPLYTQPAPAVPAPADPLIHTTDRYVPEPDERIVAIDRNGSWLLDKKGGGRQRMSFHEPSDDLPADAPRWTAMKDTLNTLMAVNFKTDWEKAVDLTIKLSNQMAAFPLAAAPSGGARLESHQRPCGCTKNGTMAARWNCDYCNGSGEVTVTSTPTPQPKGDTR